MIVVNLCVRTFHYIQLVQLYGLDLFNCLFHTIILCTSLLNQMEGIILINAKHYF